MYIGHRKEFEAYCLQYNYYDVRLDNLILDQLAIP